MRTPIVRAIAVLIICSSALWANEQAQTQMLKELFALPVPKWKEHLSKHRQLLNDPFFAAVEQRIRWGIDHNHIEDAIRFCIMGDMASQAVGRPANFRLDLARAFLAAGNTDAAKDLVANILISTSKKEAKGARFLDGQIKMREKNYYDAHKAFEELANENYETPDCYYLMSECSFYAGEEERSLLELEKAKDLGHPKAAELWAQRQENLAKSNPGLSPKPPGANVEVLLEEADYFIEQGEPEKAEAPYLKALQLDPKHIKAQVYLGALYYRLGDLEQASSYLERATKLDAGDLEAWRFLGNTLERIYDTAGGSDNLEKAMSAYQKSMELAPNDPVVKTEYERIKNKMKGSAATP